MMTHTAWRVDMLAAAARTIADLTDNDGYAMAASDELVDKIAASLDEKLQALGPDAPALDKLGDFIGSALAGEDFKYTCASADGRMPAKLCRRARSSLE